MTETPELAEIAHTGGKVTFKIRKNAEGRVGYSVQYTHSSPTKMALFALWAIPQGVPAADIKLGGIGDPFNAPPLPSCYPVFVASDSEGMVGCTCPSCGGYWRGEYGGKICPYCAYVADQSVRFLTEAQRRYIEHFCDVLGSALASGEEGEHVIDMDAVADSAGEGAKRPAFYYSEERQQNHFACDACGHESDVLGRFCYCNSCGTRNDFQEFRKAVQGIRKRIQQGGANEACVRDAVAAFDTLAGQYAKQFLARVPMVASRKARIERALFHDLGRVVEIFDGMFGIRTLERLTSDEIAFIKVRFHRRHLYEHRGGEADEKYLQESGDSVRLKQVVHETQDEAHRTVNALMKIAENLHAGFHEMFPPKDEPISWHKKWGGQD